MNQFIVFLPGIMGTELYKGNDLIWPGPISSMIFPYKLMDQLLDPDLRVGDIIRWFSGSEQYNALIAKLRQAGFSEENNHLRVCPYDWRKRNEDSAEKLAQTIEIIVAENGGQGEITLVAHSMGGLVSRYYLESGLFNRRPGFTTVKNLFTLGTPHRGSPLALTAAVGLEKRLFLNKEQVKLLVERPEFPSLYQLLPPPGDDFVWDDRDRGDLYKPLSVYDHGKELGLTDANLESARVFHGGLTGRPPAGVRYFCFAGTRMPTLTHVRVARNDQALQIIRVEADDAGDGTVPSWSGGLQGVQRQFVGGEHGTIYKSRELLRTLGGLLGVKNTLDAEMPEIQVAVREKVMEPRAQAHLALSFPRSVTGLTGEVVIERVYADRSVRTAAYPVKYEGLGAEKLALTFTAPEDPSLYRIAFVKSGGDDFGASDDFFIQDTQDE